MVAMNSRSKKFSLAAVAAATALSLAAPAANADPVDDALNKIPAGQISCDQARAYWTNEAEYQSLRSQAQAIAPFHPRGAELRDALSRIDEAANRCGLRGTNAKPSQHTNTQGQKPAPAPTQGQKPAPAPAKNVVNIGAPAGTPHVDVPVAGVVTLRIPDLIAILQQALGQFNIPNLSSR